MAQKSIHYCTQILLQSFCKLLKIPPIFISKYQFGQLVKCNEDRGICQIVTIGKICGFEYCDYSDDEDNGVYYYVSNESCYIVELDGQTRPYKGDAVDRINESNVHPLDNSFMIPRLQES